VNHTKQSVARSLIATGICRLGGEHELAERYLYSIKGDIPCEAFQNELGALEWAKGSHTSARNCWEKGAGLPMADFNLGLAWLADGNRNKAANHFQQALANIPSSSGWHHLGELYQQIN
jgi:tetratricopeptide (TPR) repeat protein